MLYSLKLVYIALMIIYIPWKCFQDKLYEKYPLFVVNSQNVWVRISYKSTLFIVQVEYDSFRNLFYFFPLLLTDDTSWQVEENLTIASACYFDTYFEMLK